MARIGFAKAVAVEEDEEPRAHIDLGPPDPLLERIDRLYDNLGDFRPDELVTVEDRRQLAPLGEQRRTVRMRKAGRVIEREERKTFERVPEAIIWDPKTQAVPIASPTTANSHIVTMTLEDRLWMSGHYGTTVFGLGSVNLLEAMRLSVRLYNTAPLAKRIVNAYTYLTVGEGVNVAWDPGSFRRGGKKIQENWERIRKETGFDNYVKHAVRMTFIGGEAFTVLRDVKGGGRRMHYLEPDRVPVIFVNSEDVDDVAGYEVNAVGGRKVLLKPEEVIHHRVNRLGNVPRGIPILLPVLRNVREWDLFVENRCWINRTRARFPATVDVEGGAAQVAAAKATWKGLPQPGKIAILPKGQRLNFPPHNVGASDVADDRRLLAETIAAGVDLPVFVVIPTASDGNYSSSIVAESPMVRMFLEMQELFRPDIERLVRELSGQEDGFHVEFPPVLRRGMGELAAALGVGIQNQFISRQTAWERVRTGDRPWDGPGGELERIQREQEAFALGQIFGPGFGADAPDPNQKKADGGVGAPPEGTSQGAAASGRGERATS